MFLFFLTKERHATTPFRAKVEVQVAGRRRPTCITETLADVWPPPRDQNEVLVIYAAATLWRGHTWRVLFEYSPGASRDCRELRSLHLRDAPARRRDQVSFADLDLARRQASEARQKPEIWPIVFGHISVKFLRTNFRRSWHTCFCSKNTSCGNYFSTRSNRSATSPLSNSVVARLLPLGLGRLTASST